MTRGSWRTAFRRAFGYHLAELEHDHAVADAQHHPHVVFDQQHRLTPVGQAAQPSAEFLALPRIQARGGLVQAQQPGFRGQRAGDADQLALAHGELGGHGLGRPLLAASYLGGTAGDATR